MKFEPALVILSPVNSLNTAKFFWPIGDCINRVPLYYEEDHTRPPYIQSCNVGFRAFVGLN